MKFGLFDHVDRSDRPLAEQFDERLEFVAAADAGRSLELFAAEVIPKLGAWSRLV